MEKLKNNFSLKIIASTCTYILNKPCESDILSLYMKIVFYRYISAAQELVTIARGTLTGGNWKRKNGEPGSFDDISVFVIPLVHS